LAAGAARTSARLTGRNPRRGSASSRERPARQFAQKGVRIGIARRGELQQHAQRPLLPDQPAHAAPDRLLRALGVDLDDIDPGDLGEAVQATRRQDGRPRAKLGGVGRPDMPTARASRRRHQTNGRPVPVGERPGMNAGHGVETVDGDRSHQAPA
jgi:hypothetical protein